MVELAMGFVPTWEFLGLCRVLLGAFEVRELSIFHHSELEPKQKKNRPDFSQLWSIS
jgi:hypothetical protein